MELGGAWNEKGKGWAGGSVGVAMGPVASAGHWVQSPGGAQHTIRCAATSNMKSKTNINPMILWTCFVYGVCLN